MHQRFYPEPEREACFYPEPEREACFYPEPEREACFYPEPEREACLSHIRSNITVLITHITVLIIASFISNMSLLPHLSAI
jgi:hypothetical protein